MSAIPPQPTLAALINELRSDLSRFEREIAEVYHSLVLPHWMQELHGFPETLYGYMMRVFAWVDLLSSYWKGSTSSKGQTLRMIDFMERYINPHREAHNVAVQMWRHKLMHTAKPRPLSDPGTGKVFQWLLHWYEHLPEEQHYTFSETQESRVLNFGLMYLAQDLQRGMEAYFSELLSQPVLQANFLKVAAEVETYHYRDIA